MYKWIFAVFNTIVSISLFSQQSNFRNDISKSIVLLQKKDSTGNLIPHGTGTLLYSYKADGMYLITCEHVLRNSYVYVTQPLSEEFKKLKIHKPQTKEIIEGSEWFFEQNTASQRVELIQDSTFISDKDLDIAVIKIFPNLIFQNEKDSLNILEKSFGIPKSMLFLKNQIQIGTEITFLGFPFSIGTSKGYFYSGYYADENNTPLLRSGTVAWKSKNSPVFLVDGFSYSGNSGSPIFTKTNLMDNNPKMIGIVTAHLFDSRLGKENDINLGLVHCVWIDEILALIERKKF